MSEVDENQEVRKLLEAEIEKNRELKDKIQTMREALLIAREYIRSESAIVLINEALGVKNE